MPETEEDFITTIKNHIRELFAGLGEQQADALSDAFHKYADQRIQDHLISGVGLNRDTWLRDLTVVCLVFMVMHKFSVARVRAYFIVSEALKNTIHPLGTEQIGKIVRGHRELMYTMEECLLQENTNG
jgi:hypothetical protein